MSKEGVVIRRREGRPRGPLRGSGGKYAGGGNGRKNKEEGDLFVCGKRSVGRCRAVEAEARRPPPAVSGANGAAGGDQRGRQQGVGFWVGSAEDRPIQCDAPFQFGSRLERWKGNAIRTAG